MSFFHKFLNIDPLDSDDCQCDTCIPAAEAESLDDDETDPYLDLPIEYVPSLPRVIEIREPPLGRDQFTLGVGALVGLNAVEYRLTEARTDGYLRYERVDE